MRHNGPKPPRDGDWELPELWVERKDNWLLDDSRPEIRNTISGRLKSSLLTARIVRLIRSTLQEYDQDAETPRNGEWHASRYLGSGAFGAAAVFTKSDGDKILDEIVVKEVTVIPRTGIRRRPHNAIDRFISEEALLHRALSTYRSDSKRQRHPWTFELLTNPRPRTFSRLQSYLSTLKASIRRARQ